MRQVSTRPKRTEKLATIGYTAASQRRAIPTPHKDVKQFQPEDNNRKWKKKITVNSNHYYTNKNKHIYGNH